MKNNVYVRSSKSIKSIELTRLLFFLPLIIYGIYKDGIFLYQNKYVKALYILKPIIYIGIGLLIGVIINLFCEKVIKRSDDKFINSIFSSFHIEYGVLIAMLISLNTNIVVFSVVTFLSLLLSKISKNRINTVCFAFILIYLISNYIGDFSFLTKYESDKVLNLSFLDYLIGRGSGGIGTTHILLIIISLIGLELTNNNKTTIAISSIVTLGLCFFIYSIVKSVSFNELMFLNNNLFLLSFVATDFQTSCYTKKGMMYYGVLVGLLSFGLTFIKPIGYVLATPISILVISLFNNLIDRKLGK